VGGVSHSREKCAELRRLGLTIEEICETVGIAQSTVVRHIQEAGLSHAKIPKPLRHETASILRRIKAGDDVEQMVARFSSCTSLVSQRIKRARHLGLVEPSTESGRYKLTPLGESELQRWFEIQAKQGRTS
jgi:hypothetical protein